MIPQGYNASMPRTPRKKGAPITPTGRVGHTPEDRFIMEQVGSNLKRVRTEVHWTQADMAEYLKMSESMYKKIEQGHNFLKPSHFHTLATMNVSMQFLLTGVGETFKGRPTIYPVH